MKVGYLLDTHVGAYGSPRVSPTEAADQMAALLHEAVVAEDAGFDGVFVPERHMRSETAWPNPFLLLTALATRTSRVDLGTYTSVMTLYDPMHVAEMTAIVDNLSRGRLIFAPSMGYHPNYFQMFGLSRRQRVSRFDEGLEVLLKAWTGEQFSFSGTRFNYHSVQLMPGPFQQPRPRLWIGSQSDAGLERAARHADGIAGYPLPLDLPRWNAILERYREAAATHSNPTTTVAVMREGFIADSRADALRLVGDAMLEEFRFAFRWGGFPPHPDFESIDDVTLDALLPHTVFGGVDDGVQALHRFSNELSCDYLILRMRFPLGPDWAATRQSIQRFAEVLDRFRSECDHQTKEERT